MACTTQRCVPAAPLPERTRIRIAVAWQVEGVVTFGNVFVKAGGWDNVLTALLRLVGKVNGNATASATSGAKAPAVNDTIAMR